MGPWLEFDGNREQVVGHQKANLLVRGSYRGPFSIAEVADGSTDRRRGKPAV
jgi:hypothetical protein